MTKKNILFIQGIADNKQIKVMKMQKDGVPIVQYNGTANIFKYINSDKINKSLLTFDTNPKQETMQLRFDAVFNQISDPDSHKTTLLKVEAMQKSLPPFVPFFNQPENIRKTSRNNIYKLLQKIDKLHVPKTVKIQPTSPSDIYDVIEKKGYTFPVIFKKAGDHGGKSTILIENKDEQFHAFTLDGRDYYLTQYVDYRENDLYSKYRLVVIDGEVFIRHVIFSDKWMIHSGSRNFMTKNKKFQKEESTLLKSFDKKIKSKIQPIITDIYNRLNLDYFGMDCHIDKQYNITIFEVNANMNILSNSHGGENSIWDSKVKYIKNAIEKMIERKLGS